MAGTVGPSYAVQSIEPLVGPVTGNTPIRIYGLGFFDSPLVQDSLPAPLVDLSCVDAECCCE